MTEPPLRLSLWEPGAIVRLIPLRTALNFWRVREHTDYREGVRVRYYRTSRGIVVLSVKAIVS